MIDIMKMMGEELNRTQFFVNSEQVRSNLKISPQKKPLGIAHAMFFKDFKDFEEMRQRSRPFVGIFRFRSLRKLDRRDRGSWQSNTHGRVKVKRIKADRSRRKWCRRFVQILTTYVLKRL